MRLIILTTIFLTLSLVTLLAQIDPEYLLELKKGTTAEMNAITPVKGVLLYNTDDDKVYRFDGSVWSAVGEDGDWTRVGSDQYSAVSGNVGIGTNNPQRLLHLSQDSPSGLTMLALENSNATNGNSSIVSFRTKTTGAGATDFVETAAITANYEEHDHASQATDLTLWAKDGNTWNNAILKANGDFGIGTTDPKVHLNNNTSSITANLEISTTGKTGVDGRTDLSLFSDLDGSNPANIFLQGKLSNGKYGWATWSFRGNHSLAEYKDWVDFGLNDGTTTKEQVMRMNVLNGDVAFNAGNVGIGTTTPDEKLQIAGNMRLDGAFEDKDGDAGSAGQVLTSTVTGTDWVDFAESNASSITAGNWYRIAINDAGGKRANADFTLRDLISGGGHSTLNFKVGISYNNEANMAFTMLSHSYYSAPTFTKVRVLENTTYDAQYLEVFCSRTGNVEYSIYDNQQTSGWDPVDWTAGVIPAGYVAREFDVSGLFNVGNSKDQFTVARDGNVGIGITAPSTKLHVMGDIQLGGADNRLIRFRNLADNDHASFGELNGGLVFSGHASANVATHEHMFINNQGNIGVGTITPSGNLHVSSGTDGDAKLIIEADTDDNNEDDNPILIFKQDGGIEESAIEQQHNELHFRNSISTGGGLVFDVGTASGYENAAEAMRITPSGDVGVGTASPAEKIDVQGNIAHSGQLRSRGPNYTFPWMRFADHEWGNSTVIGAGGNTILGGGEFAWTAQPNFTTDNETLVLGSDGTISFFTNTQSGWASRINIMNLTNTGRVGINTNAPSTDLDINGQLRIRDIPAGGGSQWLVKDGSGNVRVQASDRRLKKNIVSIENSLDKIEKLDGKYFDWKENGQRDIGFIAQEVEMVLPELVSQTDDGYKALNYPQITAVLVNAVKELKQENEILRKQIQNQDFGAINASLNAEGQIVFADNEEFTIEKTGTGKFFVRFNELGMFENYSVALATEKTILPNGNPIYINLGNKTEFGFEILTQSVDKERFVKSIDADWTFTLKGKYSKENTIEASIRSIQE